uniref:GH18 domain-containing protein n=1 Tax=Anopheles epiroticus TaxID=199890 RepID=A0A182PCY5_9DIPT
MPSKPVFGFYGGWATYRNGRGRCTVDDINPRLCTHLLYAFVALDHSGSISSKSSGCRVVSSHLTQFHDTVSFTSLWHIPRTEPVFGFYGGWATYRNGRGRCTVDDINPRLCTHLLYAFVALDHSGSIVQKDYTAQSAMRRFNNLRDQNRSLKTLVSIGGAVGCGSAFSTIAASSNLRASFARNARSFCESYGFNGVDIDWEFLEGGADRANFVQLLSVLASELHGHGMLLTTSVGVNREYDVAGIARHVDYILLMSYDYNGSWDSHTGHNAPLSWGSRLDKGAPRSKLIVDLAAYGRTFTLSSTGSNGVRANASGAGPAGPYTQQSGTLAYYEVKDAFGGGYTWDDDQHVPYAWVSYDDPRSIRMKCDFIRREQLGGAMIWSIDQDEFQGDKFTLLRTVAESL